MLSKYLKNDITNTAIEVQVTKMKYNKKLKYLLKQ